MRQQSRVPKEPFTTEITQRPEANEHTHLCATLEKHCCDITWSKDGSRHDMDRIIRCSEGIGRWRRQSVVACNSEEHEGVCASATEPEVE